MSDSPEQELENLSVVEPDNPVLRQQCQTIAEEEVESEQTQAIIERMLDYVYGASNKGEERDETQPQIVGLSANQLGISKQISIVDLAIGNKEFNDLQVLINPEIVEHSEETQSGSEGCVNLPNIWGNVERFSEIVVQALDRSGNHLQLTLTGPQAVLLQHEIDHHNGKLFIDYLDNPKQAYWVPDEDLPKYREVSKNEDEVWEQFTDVSDLVVKND